MLWQFSSGVIAEIIASAVLLTLAIYFPGRDLNRQARLTGVTLIFTCALWMLSHAIEIGSSTVSFKESLVGAQLVLGMISATLWLFYIINYMGPRKFLTLRIYILSGIMPLIAVLTLSTNHFLGLAWTQAGLDSQNPYLPLQPDYGILYWTCMVYVAILTLIGSLLIMWSIIRYRNSSRRESVLLLVAAVIPLVVALTEVMGLLSFLKMSAGITPWSACIGAIILILNLPQYRLEQVIPSARDMVLERSGDCIFVLDNHNRVLELNPAAEQLTGYKITDAFGLPIEQVWPYRSTPIVSFGGALNENEELIFKQAGKQRVYDRHIYTTSDADRRLTGKVVLLTDITRRKQAEQELRASEEKYRVIFNNKIFAICIFDLETLKLLDVNDAYCRIYGYNREELLSGMTIHDITVEHQLSDAATQQILNDDTLFIPLRYHRKKDGTVFPVEIVGGQCVWQGRKGVFAIAHDITHRISSETGRQRAEDALRREKKILVQTEGVANIGSWEWDIATDTVTWSDELFRIFQMDPQEGAPSFAEHPVLYHPDDFALLKQAVGAASTDGTPYELELRIIRKDGKTRVCMARGVAERAPGGEVVRLFGSLQEITDHRQAEKTIERQAEEYRTIFDSVRPMIAYLDKEGVILRINKPGANTLGLEPKEIVGKTMYAFFPPAYADKFTAENNKVITTGEPLIGSVTDYALLSGEKRWAQIDRLPYRNDDGCITGVITFNQDITMRKLAAEALHVSEQKFRNVFENSPVGKSITSVDGVVTVNRAFADLLGYTKEELSGVKWQDISHPGDIEEINGRLEQLQTGREKSARFVKRYLKKDGTIVWADVNTLLQRDADGRPLYYITEIVDITERKMAEQEILRLNAELEQRVLDRTALLEAANRELETFAYSVSHDLRAPLRGIDGWSLALLEDCKDKLNNQEKEYISLVRSETQSMSRLIDDLLTFSRQSRAEMNRQQLDMTAMAQEIVTHLQRQIPGLLADFIIQPGLTAQGDIGLIKSVLNNLLDNAAKFSGKNAHSRVEFGQVEQDGKPAFFVRDNGVGFDMAYAHKLFGVFRRLHKPSEFPGTGIGLATVQRIINRHGGTIWVDARVNEGATFYFTLKEAV